MKSFVLSHEDARDKSDGRLKIKGQPANAGLPGKCLLKRCAYISHYQGVYRSWQIMEF